MTEQLILWWFKKIGQMALSIQSTDKMYAAGSEAIQGIVNEMLAHGRSNAETTEMPAVDLGEAS